MGDSRDLCPHLDSIGEVTKDDLLLKSKVRGQHMKEGRPSGPLRLGADVSEAGQPGSPAPLLALLWRGRGWRLLGREASDWAPAASAVTSPGAWEAPAPCPQRLEWVRRPGRNRVETPRAFPPGPPERGWGAGGPANRPPFTPEDVSSSFSAK